MKRLSQDSPVTRPRFKSSISRIRVQSVIPVPARSVLIRKQNISKEMKNIFYSIVEGVVIKKLMWPLTQN